MTGIIRIDSNPSNLIVFIDGEYQGVTPIDIYSDQGSHDWKLSSSAPMDYTGGCFVYDNKITHLILDLENKKRYEEYLDMPPEEGEEEVPEEVPTEIGVLTKVVAEGFDAVKTGISNIQKDTDELVNYEAANEGYGDIGKTLFTSSLVAITTATPNAPSDENIIACRDATIDNPVIIASSGYDVIQVHHRLGRLAPRASLFVAGTVPIFVRSSTDGKKFLPEIKIDVGRRFRLKDVYELRVRSSLAGNITRQVSVIGGGTVITYPFGGVYQITEHETETELVNVNKTAITTIVQAIPVPAGLTIGVPNNSINTTIGIRAYVHNTDDIFISGSATGTFAGGTVHTLEAGAAQRWNLAQGALIYITANSAGQYVEFGQEADA